MALLAVAALALSACGGDSDSDSGSATTPSTTTAPPVSPLPRAEFVARAEAVCKDVNARLRRLGQAPDTTAFIEIGTRAVAITNAAREQLGQLTPPAELQAGYDRLLVLLRTQTGITEEIVRAAQVNDNLSIRTLTDRAARANQRSDAVAARLGLDACATE